MKNRYIIIFVFTLVLSLKAMQKEKLSDKIPWVALMTPNAQLLINQLEKAAQEINNQEKVSLIDYQEAEQDIQYPLFKELAQEVTKIVKQVRSSEQVQANGEFRIFLLAALLEKMKQNPEFTEQEFNKEPQHVTSFNQAYAALLMDPDKREYLKNILSLIYPDQQTKEFVETIKSFDPKSSELRNLYASQDPTISSLVKKLFAQLWGPNYGPMLAVSQLRVADLRLASFAILQEIAGLSDRLLGFTSIGGSNKAFTWVWGQGAKPLISEKTIKELAQRAEIALRVAPVFKIGDPFEAIDPFDMQFFTTSLPRIFPSATSPLFTAALLNSAEFNQNFRPNPILQFFRAEEILKLIVHEVYHRAGFNKAFVGMSEQNKAWAKNFAVDFSLTPIDLNETVVEAAAALVNVIITAYESSLALKKPDSFTPYLAQMWALEKAFSLIQAAKILYISGFDTIDQFLDPEHTQVRVHQTTAATEYHVFKSALLFSSQDFLTLLLNTKDTTQTYDPQVTAPQLRDLIKNMLSSAEFKQKINAIITWLKKQSEPTALTKTGRMTLIEYNVGLPVQSIK